MCVAQVSPLLTFCLNSWEREYAPDNKGRLEHAKNYDFYRRVLTPRSEESSLVSQPEFQSNWLQNLKALGRREVPENVPWRAEFDPNFQDREDMQGLVRAEQLIAGSGLEVSRECLLLSLHGSYLMLHFPFSATTRVRWKAESGILIQKHGAVIALPTLLLWDPGPNIAFHSSTCP